MENLIRTSEPLKQRAREAAEEGLKYFSEQNIDFHCCKKL